MSKNGKEASNLNHDEGLSGITLLAEEDARQILGIIDSRAKELIDSRSRCAESEMQRVREMGANLLERSNDVIRAAMELNSYVRSIDVGESDEPESEELAHESGQGGDSSLWEAAARSALKDMVSGGAVTPDKEPGGYIEHRQYKFTIRGGGIRKTVHASYFEGKVNGRRSKWVKVHGGGKNREPMKFQWGAIRSEWMPGALFMIYQLIYSQDKNFRCVRTSSSAARSGAKFGYLRASDMKRYLDDNHDWPMSKYKVQAAINLLISVGIIVSDGSTSSRTYGPCEKIQEKFDRVGFRDHLGMAELIADRLIFGLTENAPEGWATD